MLARPIMAVAQAVREFKDEFVKWGSHDSITKCDLRKMEERIMSAISDFAAKQNAFNQRIGAAIDGVVADVKTLNDKIEELQNSGGAITPEDQALLDSLQEQGEALATKLEALDNLTPPTPPAG